MQWLNAISISNFKSLFFFKGQRSWVWLILLWNTFYTLKCLGRFLKPITIQCEILHGMFVTNITSKNWKKKNSFNQLVLSYFAIMYLFATMSSFAPLWPFFSCAHHLLLCICCNVSFSLASSTLCNLHWIYYLEFIIVNG